MFYCCYMYNMGVKLPVLLSLEPNFAVQTNIQDRDVALCLITDQCNNTLTIITDNSLFKPAFSMSWNREWQNIVRHSVITIQLYVLGWNISWEYPLVSSNTYVLNISCSTCVSQGWKHICYQNLSYIIKWLTDWQTDI